MADSVSLPVGGTQIDSLPSKTAVQDTDKIPISRDGSTASVTVADFNDKTNGIVSDAFSTNVAYEVGDYCIYNDTLYKCTTAHSKKAWSNSDFEATDVATELSELNTNHIDYYELSSENALSSSGDNDADTVTTKINTYDGCNYYPVVSGCGWCMVTSIEIDGDTMTVSMRNPYNNSHTATARVYVIASKF